jgi:hypothetical protein
LAFAGLARISADTRAESTSHRGVFDKITRSSLESTTQDIASRDHGIDGIDGIDAFVFVDVAVEIGIEPQCGKAADLGYIPRAGYEGYERLRLRAPRRGRAFRLPTSNSPGVRCLQMSRPSVLNFDA